MKKKKTRRGRTGTRIGRVPVKHSISGYKHYRIIIYRSANIGDLFIELHSGYKIFFFLVVVMEILLSLLFLFFP